MRNMRRSGRPENRLPRVAQAGWALTIVGELRELLLGLGLKSAVVDRGAGYVEVVRFQYSQLKFHHTQAFVDRCKLPALRIARPFHCNTRRVALERDGHSLDQSRGTGLLLGIYQSPVGVTVFVDGRCRR